MLEQLAQQNGPLAFFRAQGQAFAETLTERRQRPDLIDGLLSRAYTSFEVNAAEQSAGYGSLACYKGCATCCTLRVTATAPEVLLIAKYVRQSEPGLRQRGINLAKRVARADAVTQGLGEQERVQLKRQCPFLLEGCCFIYVVRPLACRGHASYDKRACQDAASGHAQQIPYSVAHMTVRSLIQSALQSALRDAGLAWASYELNQAVSMALLQDICREAWQAGADVFQSAQATEVDFGELAAAYDALKLV